MHRLVEIFLNAAKIEAKSGNEKPLADFITSFLQQHNYSFTIDDSWQSSGSNTGNIICRIGDGGDSVLLSHMDTARPTKYTVPKITDNKIISSSDTVLGVDNRAGVAVLLYVLGKIAAEKIETKNFTVAFTTCEETTLSGSKNLSVNGAIKKGFVFDSSFRPGNFIHTACGSMGFKATVRGKASHSGLAPEKGIDSIQVISRAISKMRLGRIDEETSANIGKINGGSAVNVVPEETRIDGEVRSFNREKVEKEINFIKECISSEADKVSAKLFFEADWDFEPYYVPEESPVYKEITEAIKSCGLEPHPKISLGGSDANSLNARGITSVNIGIGAQNPHSNDEFIFIEDLLNSAKIALNLISK